MINIITLRKELDSAKQKKSKIEGSLSVYMDRLKKEFDCSTVDEANEKMKKLGKDISALKIKFDKKIEEINSKYETHD